MKELLKSTKEDHKDRKSLEQAKDKIDAIVSTVNERTKQVEVMMKTMEAIQKIKGGRDLHSPTRKFISDAPVVVRFSSEAEHMHKYHIFLFNDLIAFTKPPKLLSREKYYLQSTVEHSNIFVADIEDQEGKFFMRK